MDGTPHPDPAAAVSLAATGLLTLTIQYLMAPTHTIGGVNWADAWHAALTVIGAGLILSGIITVFYTERKAIRPQALKTDPCQTHG